MLNLGKGAVVLKSSLEVIPTTLDCLSYFSCKFSLVCESPKKKRVPGSGVRVADSKFIHQKKEKEEEGCRTYRASTPPPIPLSPIQ